MQGHIFKYKDKEGNWIEIPVLVESMYNAYVIYCTKNNIEPVTEAIYYQSVGQLQKLVEDLGGSAENINAIANAIGQGALPQNLGGLGVTVGTTEYPDLQTALVKLANVVTSEELAECITTINNSIAAVSTTVSGLSNSKADEASFASGDKDPTTTTPGKYYFQYK